MTLLKLSNKNSQNTLNPWFSDVLESVFNEPGFVERPAISIPGVNIAENENEFKIELAVPGLNKEDFKISLDKQILTVSATKETKDGTEVENYSKREYNYGSFARSFNLSESVDYSKIHAAYHAGILTVTVAKKEEAKFQSREIAIN
ncbi:MAG: Hsp20/alpha crystallin family protein [Sphingobacteriaceae bacterium]